MTLHLYGIPNCDTVKKARAWLTAAGVEHVFHDYKQEGADPAKLAEWARAIGWEALFNRAGTTFRKLDQVDRTDIDETKAIRLMVAQPSLIKRPVAVRDDRVIAGFSPDRYAAAFG
jgi:arsenate reductase